MAFFAIVVVFYLVQVLCFAAQTIPISIVVLFGFNQLGDVDSNSQDGASLALSILLFPSAAVFFLLPSLSGKI